MLSPLLPLLLALTPAPPPASPPVRVSPTLLDLDAREDDAELWLSNEGDQPWPAEVHLYRWQQHDDGERLTPATDLIASPSRFELPAGGRQRLRLVRLPAAGAAGEQAYRLLVEQRVQAGTTGQPRLRHSLPVFVHNGAPGTPAQIQAAVEGDRAQPLLSLHNPGQRHARLTWLAWIDAHGQRSVLLPGLAGYLLPGASRRWALPAREDGYRGGHFQARINDAPASPLAPLRLAADARP